MRQNASERPVKEPRKSKSDDFLTNMTYGLWVRKESMMNFLKRMWVVLIAGKNDSRQMVMNVSLRKERDDPRSTRDGEANDTEG